MFSTKIECYKIGNKVCGYPRVKCENDPERNTRIMTAETGSVNNMSWDPQYVPLGFLCPPSPTCAKTESLVAVPQVLKVSNEDP
jgi:hypothetical protein